jgi:hypothetical protein
VIDLRDTCQPDGAADRAASAARTLAAIANDAARKHVQRYAVTPQTHGADVDPMVRAQRFAAGFTGDHPRHGLDAAERERQARLRRWHELPHSNRKGG